MKRLIIAALILIPVMGWAQIDTYTVKGEFKDPTISGKVYMTYFNGAETQKDSSLVQNGIFEFIGPSDGPQQVYMSFRSNDKSKGMPTKGIDARSLYLDKGTVFIDAIDSLKTATISGVAINAEAEKYKSAIASVEAENNRFRTEFRKMTPEQRNDKVLTSGLEAKIQESSKAIDEALKLYVKENPDSYFSLDALQKIAGSYFDITKVEPLFNELSTKLRATKEGLAFAASIAATKATIVGVMAPDFTQMDVNGKQVKLSDFRGQYVLIDFWASWCGPCRAENPKVLKAYNAFKDKNFTVLGVSIDRADKKAEWLKAIEEDGMPWTQLVDPDHTDPNGAANLYAIKAIPSNFLIDPNGKIIAKNLRGDALEKELSKVIK